MTRVKNDDRMLSVQDVAARAGISIDLAYDEVGRGNLVASRIGRIIRVRESEFEAWLERGVVRKRRRSA